jgi:hypothetical protein
MPLQIEDVRVLQDYVSGVMARSEHHARGVKEVCLTILGGIIWKAESIEVLVMDGETKNVLWMTVAGSRYAFSFVHDEMVVEVRRNNTHGAVLASFSNQSHSSEVLLFFRSLPK